MSVLLFMGPKVHGPTAAVELGSSADFDHVCM